MSFWKFTSTLLPKTIGNCRKISFSPAKPTQWEKTIAEYVATLRKLAPHCKFGKNLDQVLHNPQCADSRVKDVS